MPDGTSVLMQFDSLYELKKYVQVFYLEFRSKETTYFQMQIIDVTTTENQCTTLAHSLISAPQRQNL